jgi:DNA-binding winged helix-turn-helix (wHTH) protein/TolB-like protein
MDRGPVYVFGPFRYDAGQRLLFREGELVAVAPKAMETLQVLLEHRGRVVDKAELMKLVWPDTAVEEVGLARNISLLRKALGDEADAGAYIETIPKRGYRFIAAVEVQASATEELRQSAPPPVARRPRTVWWTVAAALTVAVGAIIYWQFYVPSRYLPRGNGLAGLAVVPFECLTPETDCATFSRELSELLVADLSKLRGVLVVSPSTVRRHQKAGMSMGLMGRLLNLDVLVEGTVGRIGDRRRITARLVDVHTGKVIWAETYDQTSDETGQAQTEVARAVAAQVGARLEHGTIR